MLLEQYSLVILAATYFTYALTIGFISILSFKACLQKAAWNTGFIKQFNPNWQTELLKAL
jgi:hypothetical protein